MNPKAPKKETIGVLVRLDSDLYDKARAECQRLDRSFAWWIRQLIKIAVDHREQYQPPSHSTDESDISS